MVYCVCGVHATSCTIHGYFILWDRCAIILQDPLVSDDASILHVVHFLHGMHWIIHCFPCCILKILQVLPWWWWWLCLCMLLHAECLHYIYVHAEIVPALFGFGCGKERVLQRFRCCELLSRLPSSGLVAEKKEFCSAFAAVSCFRACPVRVWSRKRKSSAALSLL